MNEMDNIYRNEADLYDVLVGHEDYQHNLFDFLNSNIDFVDKTICEFGVGTGRVTKTYIDKVKSADLFDRSKKMLEQSKKNLANQIHKITLNEFDNRNIDQVLTNYDISIEGWSFGHLISENYDNVEYWSNRIIDELKRISSKIVIIETLGTNVEKPFPPNPSLSSFYNLLKKNGFNEYIIRTDYKFESVEQAKYVLGSFFGKEMKEDIRKGKKNRIKEFTGIWIL